MQDRTGAASFSAPFAPSSSSPLPFVNVRLPYHYPTPSTSSPFSTYPDAPFPLSSKSYPSLSRQPSIDFSHLLTQSFQPLSRQSSLSTSTPLSFDEDPFAFLAFDSVDSFKTDPFDVSTRVASYDSDLSSTSEWSTGSGEEDNSPRSPQSSVTSLSESSQSSDTEYVNNEEFSNSPVLPSSYVGLDEQWQSNRLQRQSQGTSLLQLPLKVSEFSGDVGAASVTSSSVPTLPLPFTQPVYAFNYHSAEEESASISHSSSHERRDGLRGGGNTRAPYPSHSHAGQDTSDTDNDSSNDSSYNHSSSSTPPTVSLPSNAFIDNISPKSLLLSLSASHTPASTSTHSSSHSSHFSVSSSSASVTASPMSEDPNEIVIGIYTRAERAAKIARYREKRANRQWKKKIMYGCRKSFADNRPRVGGRFIKMKGTEEDKQRGSK